MDAASKKPAPTVGELTGEAAVQALRRLIGLLLDPETPNADVLQASALVFERIYPLQTGNPPAGGDYEICVKED